MSLSQQLSSGHSITANQNKRTTFIVPVVYFAILLVGGTLRFSHLTKQSLWDDEMFTIRYLSCSVSEAAQIMTHYEAHPPLYFAQLRLWKDLAVGSSLAGLRANSALWGTLSLCLLYALGKRVLESSWGGLGAMALLACSPFHLAYSQELRAYTLAIFLALSAFLLIEKLKEGSTSLRVWWGLLLLGVAQMYTHYWGMFTVFAQMIYGYMGLHRSRYLGRWIFGSVVTGILFLPWLFVLVKQMGIASEAIFWMAPPSIKNLGLTFLAYTGIDFKFASSEFVLSPLTGIQILLGAIYSAVFLRGLSEPARLGKIWLLAGLVCPFAFSFIVPNIYLWYRHPVIVYPAFLLILMSGLKEVPHRKVIPFLFSIFLAASFWGDWIYFTSWEKANPKSVMQHVNSLSDAASVVVRPSYFAKLFSYYDETGAMVIDQHTLDSVEKRAALKGKHLVLLAFDVPSDPITEAFLKEYRVVSSRSFPGEAHLGITVYCLEERAASSK